MSTTNGSTNGAGALPAATRSASRSSASATARARSCRASSTTATPIRASPVPGLMHVDLGGYHVRDIEFTAAFDIDADKVGKDLSEGDLRRPEQHAEARRRRPQARRRGAARDDPRRPRQVPQGEDHQGARPDRRHRRDPQGDTHRRRRLLPPGRLRAGDQVVRRAGARGRLRLRQLHPGVHRPRGVLEQALQEGRRCRSSATTSSRRSARRSSTARSRGCSTTAASSCCAPRS